MFTDYDEHKPKWLRYLGGFTYAGVIEGYPGEICELLRLPKDPENGVLACLCRDFFPEHELQVRFNSKTMELVGYTLTRVEDKSTVDLGQSDYLCRPFGKELVGVSRDVVYPRFNCDTFDTLSDTNAIKYYLDKSGCLYGVLQLPEAFKFEKQLQLFLRGHRAFLGYYELVWVYGGDFDYLEGTVFGYSLTTPENKKIKLRCGDYLAQKVGESEITVVPLDSGIESWLPIGPITMENYFDLRAAPAVA